MVEGFATLIAAGLATAASLLVVIITKEQKISEFRQQWIDSLRADASEFTARIRGFKIAIDLYRPTLNDLNFYVANRDYALALATLSDRIKLRLNPTEDAHNALRQALDAAADQLMEPPGSEVASAENIRDIVQGILKTEWDRVKRGERMHLLAQRILFGIATIFLVASLWVAWDQILHPMLEDRASAVPTINKTGEPAK